MGRAGSLVYSVEHEGAQRVVCAHMRFPPDYFTPILTYARAFAEVHEVPGVPIRLVIEEADASSARWLEQVVIGEQLNGNDVRGVCEKVYDADEFTEVISKRGFAERDYACDLKHVA